MVAIIHIGPPKTASTSIQNSILPKLGRPFAVKPDWMGTLCRWDVFFAPPPPPDFIVSDEYIGEFSHASPGTICDRLSQVFPQGARVVQVHRDPVELFASYYRQKIVNTVTGIDRVLGADLVPLRITPDNFFDQHAVQYREQGIGFFAMASTKAVRAAFEKRFEVVTIDFALLRQDRRAFAAAFCRACDSTEDIALSSENMASVAELEAAIAAAPVTVDEDIKAFWRAGYQQPLPSAERIAVLRNLAAA